MALAGDHVQVTLDDSSGTPRIFAAGDILSVDIGLQVQQHDVTGFGQAVQNFINGQFRAPLTLRGFLTNTATTGTHTVINGAYQAGSTVTLKVAIGNNTAPTTGDPKFEGEYLISSYRPVMSTGSAVTFEAVLVPASGTAPVWGVV